MARRRGFFAEIQRQNKAAAREREQAQRAAVRQHDAAVRQAEQAHRKAEQARVKAAKAAAAEQKRAEQEARKLYIAAKEAEAAELNARLAETYDEIDSLLSWTLEFDDFVDLETLRQVAEHPPFGPKELEAPIPPPVPLAAPSEPVFAPPPAPKGLAAVLGKKKQAKALTEAQAAHQEAVIAWKEESKKFAVRQQEQIETHQRAEQERLTQLAAARTQYDAECDAREQEITASNAELDELVTGLGYGTADAIQEYVAIVLSNSIYPNAFPVEHEFAFDAATAELSLRVLIPGPDKIPTTKSYRYNKSADKITETELSQKQRKDRYGSAVHQVALRSLHEVFEADRRALIKTISLELGTNAIAPATGRLLYVPFVAVAVERDVFMDIELSEVLPAATLDHLGAVVSKNPTNLVPIDPSGVRSGGVN